MNTSDYIRKILVNKRDDLETEWTTYDLNTGQLDTGYYDTWYKNIKPMEWTTARGSGKSDLDAIVKYLATVYTTDSPNKNATVFCKNTIRTPLPETYPKGDINDLLGIEEA